MLIPSVGEYNKIGLGKKYGHDIALFINNDLAPLCTKDCIVLNDLMHYIMYGEQGLPRGTQVTLDVLRNGDLEFSHNLISSFDDLVLYNLYLKDSGFVYTFATRLMTFICNRLDIPATQSIEKVLDGTELITQFHTHDIIYKEIKKIPKKNSWQQMFILGYSFDHYLNAYFRSEKLKDYGSSEVFFITDAEYSEVLNSHDDKGKYIRYAREDNRDSILFNLVEIGLAGRMYVFVQARAVLEEWFKDEQYLNLLIHTLDKIIYGTVSDFIGESLGFDKTIDSVPMVFIRGALAYVIDRPIVVKDFTEKGIEMIIDGIIIQEVDKDKTTELNSF